MNWYKFHLGDYLKNTGHLSDAHDLALRRLLDLYYLTEQPLKRDTTWLAWKIGIDLDIVETVLEEFFELRDNGYFNKRCDVEITKYTKQVAVNREIGKRGGRPKKSV
jgi:uncharacterized protein YdaU (DUF1376 family)